MNVYGETERRETRPGYVWTGARIGGEQIGASLYDLPAGERICPYHYHYGIEEWLVVVTGAPTLRTPEGERQLRAGDVACFPAGPAGAHSVTGPGRVLMVSNLVYPSVSVYPDSDKIGTRPALESEDRLNFPRSSAVDYWEGE